MASPKKAYRVSVVVGRNGAEEMFDVTNRPPKVRGLSLRRGRDGGFTAAKTRRSSLREPRPPCALRPDERGPIPGRDHRRLHEPWQGNCRQSSKGGAAL